MRPSILTYLPILIIVNACGNGGVDSTSVSAPNLNTNYESTNFINEVSLNSTVTITPSDATIEVGQIATFTAIANGSGLLTYQWTKNGNIILGATNAIYITPKVTLADSDSVIAVIVTSSSGSITSNSAKLTVKPAVPCISSGTDVDINSILTNVNSEAVLCQGAIFDLNSPITLNKDGQKIYL